MDKDEILHSLIRELDKTEKVARKYLNACVHLIEEREGLDRTRMLVNRLLPLVSKLESAPDEVRPS